MRPKPLFQRWSVQNRALLTELVDLFRQTRRRGASEDVHRVRVTTRRLRLLVRLGATAYPPEAADDFRTWGRRVARATDALRDLDVTLEWLANKPKSQPTAELLRSKRERLLVQAQKRLPEFSLGLRRTLRSPKSNSRQADRLHRRIERLANRIEDHVHAQAPRLSRLSREEQHEFRRQIRRWRYLRELQLPTKQQKTDVLLRRLVRLQGVLGKRQNLRLTDAFLSELPATPELKTLRRRLRADLKQFSARVDKARAWLT